MGVMAVPFNQSHSPVKATGAAVGAIVPSQNPFKVHPMAELSEPGAKFSPALQ
jgi:hypothetical protein